MDELLRSGLVSFEITQQRTEIKSFHGGSCQTPRLTLLEPLEGLLVHLSGLTVFLDPRVSICPCRTLNRSMDKL